MTDITIRGATPADADAILAIFHARLEAGETYSYEAGTSPETGLAYWLGTGVSAFVAVAPSEGVLGMYRIVPNQPGRGAHVANASYMVSPSAQGRGVGRMMGEHSLAQARQQGYLAMQFNYVISTNAPAIRLWQSLGFDIVATLPKAYRHQRLGYVDALVMYQLLRDPADWPDAAR